MNGAPSRLSRRPIGGFTIVETLIVMAVSGLLLISSILLVAGQQRKVEFSQAVQDVQSVINQTISEVGSGYYPNGKDFKCTVSGGKLVIVPALSGTAQGSNTGCIFLGKAIQFGKSGTNPQEYVVHAIAGLQDKQDGTLATAKPKAVNIASSQTTGQLRNGLTIKAMRYIKDGAPTKIGAVAFLSGLGTGSDNNLLSGTQQLSLVPVIGSGIVPTTTVTTVVSAIDTQLVTSDGLVNPNGGVELCFQGGAGQWGLITIGGNGRNLSVKLDIKNSDCS
jgi:type II secretory pathway pseudopilin PulG